MTLIRIMFFTYTRLFIGSNKLHELRTSLLSLNFVTSSADSSLFVYSHGNALLHLLFYVDDLIITGSDPSFVDNIIGNLALNSPKRILG